MVMKSPGQQYNILIRIIYIVHPSTRHLSSVLGNTLSLNSVEWNNIIHSNNLFKKQRGKYAQDKCTHYNQVKLFLARKCVNTLKFYIAVM